MSMGQKPEIWTKTQFQGATGGPAATRPRKKLESIDTMLEQWANVKDGSVSSQKVDALRRLAIATTDYLIRQRQKKKDKETSILPGGPSEILTKRIQGAETLVKQVFIRLAFEQFEHMKQTRVNTPGTALKKAQVKSLKSDYQIEKVVFDAAKTSANLAGVPSVNNAAGQINPPSASFLKEVHTKVSKGTLTLAGGNPQFTENFASVPFTQLTDAELVKLYNSAKEMGPDVLNDNDFQNKPRVHYYRKDERINDLMLISFNNLLHDSHGNLYSTRKQGKFFLLNIYAMDTYGNFFVKEVTQDGARDPKTQYNHSSLVAGREVMCAGVVCIENGKVLEIGNESGHYHPTPTQLSSTLAVLAAEYDLPVGETVQLITAVALTGQVHNFKNLKEFWAAFPPP